MDLREGRRKKKKEWGVYKQNKTVTLFLFLILFYFSFFVFSFLKKKKKADCTELNLCLFRVFPTHVSVMAKKEMERARYPSRKEKNA